MFLSRIEQEWQELQAEVGELSPPGSQERPNHPSRGGHHHRAPCSLGQQVCNSLDLSCL